MPHKTVNKAEITKIKDEIGRLTKAIDRLRVYSHAKDNETIKSVLNEVRIVRASAVRRKDAALENFTPEGSGEARHWHGYELGLSYLINTFENPDEEIKEYLERRKRLEKHLDTMRTKYEVR